MNHSILEAAEIIRGAEGEEFLRLMATAYSDPSLVEAGGRASAALNSAERIGLLTRVGGRLNLTSPGFLVGNVAKEYRIYVDNGRCLPTPKPPREMIAGKDVLDVGCSFGRWLWEFQRDARTTCGVEPQAEYAVLGRALSVREGLPPPNIVVGTAEELNELTGTGRFDLVFCRLVLNYVRIQPVLGKMFAALRPGGVIWLQVESPWFLPKRLVGRNVSLRRRAWVLLAMVNLPVCILTGRQLSIASRGRMHERHNPVYPPLGWWRRALRKHGLRNFRTFPADSLVFCAEK